MTLTTPTAAEAWRPNVISTFNPDDMLNEALIVRAASWAGTVEGDEPSVLVPYVPTDPAAGFVAEGEQIGLSDIAAAQVAINTDKVAVVTRVSREMTTQPGAAERIANSLRRSVTTKADAAFLGNAANPTGLVNMAGVPNAGTIGADAWAVYDAVAAIEADGGQATHIIVNPLDWGALSQVPQATGSNLPLLPQTTTVEQRALGGVPAIVHAAMPQGTALVLDRSEVVAAYGQLQLARSEDAFFTMDAVAIRATWRIGWNVVRPDRLQLLTVTTA